MAEEGPAGATPGVLHKIVLCTMQNIYCVESAEMFLMLCTAPEKKCERCKSNRIKGH